MLEMELAPIMFFCLILLVGWVVRLAIRRVCALNAIRSSIPLIMGNVNSFLMKIIIVCVDLGALIVPMVAAQLV